MAPKAFLMVGGLTPSDPTVTPRDSSRTARKGSNFSFDADPQFDRSFGWSTNAHPCGGREDARPPQGRLPLRQGDSQTVKKRRVNTLAELRCDTIKFDVTSARVSRHAVAAVTAQIARCAGASTARLLGHSRHAVAAVTAQIARCAGAKATAGIDLSFIDAPLSIAHRLAAGGRVREGWHHQG